MPRPDKRPSALFVGLCTLDVIQLVAHVPTPNEKLTAQDQTLAAGGPAANAAAAHRHLGGRATLLTAIGAHPLAAGITADLASLGVDFIDLAANSPEPPTVSSILVTASTGERAVASTNASRQRVVAPPDLATLVEAAQVVEFDGHHPDLALSAARTARAMGRITLFDGGSWKPGSTALLAMTDIAVCSADFHPPGASGPHDTLNFLHAQGVPWAAISRGNGPILWSGPTPDVGSEITVPPTPVVDTLGAGDVLHGALAYYLSTAPTLDAHTFPAALRRAATVASRACASFGTRTWMRGAR